MDFNSQLYITTIATITTVIFVICGVKLRWFRPDNRLPPPFTIVDHDGDSCCAVCLNDVVGSEDCRKLPKCGHVFHLVCVDKWLECNWTCPICRRQVTDDLPKREGQNTILSSLIAKGEDFMVKIFSPFTEELMMVLIESVVLPRVQ